MSAGNPFRRSQASRPADERTSTAPQLDLDTNLGRDDDATPPPTKTTKPKKRVQIRSPPASPTSPDEPSRPGIGRRLSAGRDGSPPPADTPAVRADNTYEPVANSKTGMEQEAMENMRRNTGGMAQEPAAPARPSGAPLNPFARTMASNEAALGRGGSGEQEQEAQLRPPGGRGRMDVDAFKNILMTGSATPSPPVDKAPGAVAQASVQDNGSGTDTSSGSRHSLFDPTIDSLRSPDSPRTSFDHEHSSGEDDDDNEHANLVGKAGAHDSRSTQQKRGKAGGLRGPQTVSFADFDETIPSPKTPTGEHPPFTATMPPLSRSTSDLNKPLPPPPEDRSSVEVARPAVPDKDETYVQNENTETETEEQRGESELPPAAAQTADLEPPSSAKKPPPPPPASRRQGAHTRARSSSNQTTNSANEDESPDPATIAPTAPKPPNPQPRQPPRPPPSRRTQALASPSPSPALETPPPTETPHPPTQTPDANSLAPPEAAPSPSQRPSMPPPPTPRRNPSKTGSFTRTPSNASHTSGASVSLNSTSAAPPPPPPSRRSKPLSSAAGSSDRRTSSQSERPESISGERAGSWGSLPVEGEGGGEGGGEASGQKDILADIAALQREVDELRAKAGKS